MTGLPDSGYHRRLDFRERTRHMALARDLQNARRPHPAEETCVNLISPGNETEYSPLSIYRAPRIKGAGDYLDTTLANRVGRGLTLEPCFPEGGMCFAAQVQETTRVPPSTLICIGYQGSRPIKGRYASHLSSLKTSYHTRSGSNREKNPRIQTLLRNTYG